MPSTIHRATPRIPLTFARAAAALLLVLCATPSAAASLTIPATHPRLWYGNAQRLADARAYFATHPIDAGTDPQLLALRGLLANSAADCSNAVTRLMNFVLVPSRGDGFRDPMRTQGESMILVYDWCHALISDTQRATLVDRWNTWIRYDNDDPTLAGPSKGANNYWWGRTNNTLLWGIASFGDNPQAQAFIDEAIDSRMGVHFDRWYRQFGRGGVFIEGSDYGSVMLSYPIIAFQSAQDFGFDVYARTPFFREAIYGLYYGTTPGPTTSVGGTGTPYMLFPFNDVEHFFDGGVIAIRDYLGDFAAYVGQRDATGNAKHARDWLARTGNSSRYLFDAVRSSAPHDQAGLPLDYYAPGPGVFDLRDGHGVDATQVHLQLNTPGGTEHLHADGATFQMWRRGRWITRETVSYANRFRGLAGVGIAESDDAIVHNALLFEGYSTGRWIGDGIRIIPPGQSREDNPDGLPEVVRLQHAPKFAYAAVELSKAYRNRDGRRVDWPYADRALREFLFIRDLDALVVLDRMRGSDDSFLPAYRASAGWIHPTTSGADAPRIAAADVRRTFVMHFETPPTIAGSRVSATTGNQVAELITLVPAAPTFRVIDENIAGQPQIGQHRLELDSTGSVESYFINVVHGRDVGTPALTASVVDHGASWTVVLQNAGGQRATLVLQKGMDSTGGTIALDGGAAQPLNPGVQGISVTDDGPVWGPGDVQFRDGYESP